MTRSSQWLLAIRPKTLGISIAPVVAGTSLAWAETAQINWLVAIAALTGALLIQIGTNLHNDAADFERGADSGDRLGPARATAQGWFTATQVKNAAFLAFSLAFVPGVYLVWVGGWPIVILGLVSLAAGYSYTGGRKPIAYSASGEVFVFIFFGLAATAGIQEGDLIVEVNGRSVADPKELARIIAAVDPGEAVEVALYRDGQLTAAFGRAGGIAGRGDRRSPVTDGRQPPGPRDPQLGCEHRRLGAVPGLGARQRFCRLGDLALVKAVATAFSDDTQAARQVGLAVDLAG